MIKTIALAVLAGLLAGALSTWFIAAAPRLETLDNEVGRLTGEVVRANTATSACKTELSGAQAALDGLRDQAKLRETQAQFAVAAALEANRMTGEEVMRILAEVTPEGADACAAASAAFDAELRKERGQ